MAVPERLENISDNVAKVGESNSLAAPSADVMHLLDGMYGGPGPGSGLEANQILALYRANSPVPESQEITRMLHGFEVGNFNNQSTLTNIGNAMLTPAHEMANHFGRK